MSAIVSIILPAYNEESMIEKAGKVITELLKKSDIDNEILFVDDGSIDNTWTIIQRLSESNNNIRGIHFSRNFGKEAAILAGLASAKGDCSVVIDCDLQMPPEVIIKMYQLWEQGYEVIEGRKNRRGSESIFHAIASATFYKLISNATGFDMENTSDFKMLDRKAVNALLSMQEHNAFFRALSFWIGFKTTAVYYDVKDREAGESKWSTKSLIQYALRNVSAFSTAPMQLVTMMGIIMLIISVIFSLISLTQRIMGIGLPGFTTIIILLLFSSSIIMISLGIIGYYIACIYDEVKRRPRYIISEICGDNEK